MRKKIRNSKSYFSLPFNQNLKGRAKKLRKSYNYPEVIFWNQIKNKQFKGLDFDRQKIIGNYIVDFYCGNLNLIIEIDGKVHDQNQDYDNNREEYLKSLGLKIIRFQAIDILKNMENIIGWMNENINNDE